MDPFGKGTPTVRFLMFWCTTSLCYSLSGVFFCFCVNSLLFFHMQCLMMTFYNFDILIYYLAWKQLKRLRLKTRKHIHQNFNAPLVLDFKMESSSNLSKSSNLGRKSLWFGPGHAFPNNCTSAQFWIPCGLKDHESRDTDKRFEV